jgi:uncharacterized LabA/DUF88 family protein
MKKLQNNYAFIDSQNLNLGINKLGWRLNFKKFRVYLQEKYKISKAYMFLGFLPENQKMYSSLQSAGYILVFKPIIISKEGGKIKGNVDAELVLQAMIDFEKYDKAMIVSSDGDFRCLVEYLHNKNKLEKVMSPDLNNCSVLLKKSAREKIVFMDNLRGKLEYKQKSTA